MNPDNPSPNIINNEPQTLPAQSITPTEPIPPSKPSKKKWLFLVFLLIVLVIGAGAAYAHDLKITDTNKANLQKFKKSSELSSFTSQVNTFVTDRDGLFARLYSCQVTTKDIWHPATSTKFDNVEPVDTQFTRSINELQGGFQKAQATLPKYKSPIMASVIPGAKQTKEDFQKTSDVIKRTEQFIYMNDITTYCVTTSYSSIASLRYIEDPANLLLRDSVPQLQQRLDYVTTQKNNIQSQQVGASVEESKQALEMFFEKMKIDLTALIQLKKSGSSLGFIDTSFKSDNQMLETEVFTKLRKAGDKIAPQPSEIQNQLQALSQ